MEKSYGSNVPSLGLQNSFEDEQNEALDTKIQSGPGPDIMAASTLEGNNVVNLQSVSLGEIKEIMIDVANGRVAYAVLATGGILGIGEKLNAIPWSALVLDTERKCFILDVDAERLKNAPGFDKDNWPLMEDPTWASEINRYYGQSNYWQSNKLD